jgi:hypothetical protein
MVARRTILHLHPRMAHRLPSGLCAFSSQAGMTLADWKALSLPGMAWLPRSQLGPQTLPRGSKIFVS